MNKWIWAAAICLIGSTASAQAVAPADGHRFVVDLIGGVQMAHNSVDSTLTFPLYDETAVFQASQTTAHGAFIDFGVGYRFTPVVGAALAFSNFSSKADAPVSARIPDPAFYDNPVTVNATATDMTRTERAVHLRLMWFIPASDRFEVGLSAGPSLVRISQDMPSGSVADGTQNLTIVASEETKTGVGFNAGVDGTLVMTRNVGVGIAVHYLFSSVDLPSATGVRGGGLQTGVGLHFRF